MSYPITNPITSLSPVATTGRADDLTGRAVVKADFWTYTAVNPLTNGLAAISGTTPVAGQRWFLANSSANNGVWTVTPSGAWTRHPDYNTNAQIRSTMVIAASGTGAALGSTGSFFCTNTSAITVGTTAITYNPVVSYDNLGNLNFGLLSAAAANMGLQFYSAGGSTVAANVRRLSGTNGNFSISNSGTGSIDLTTAGGVRVGSASASALYDISAVTFNIPASTTVAANGGTYTFTVDVPRSQTGFGFVTAVQRGALPLPAGVVLKEAFISAGTTATVRYINVSATLATFSTSTPVRVVFFSL